MRACVVQAVVKPKDSLQRPCPLKPVKASLKKRATSFFYSFIPPFAGHCVDLETAIQRCEKAAPETLPLTKRNI